MSIWSLIVDIIVISGSLVAVLDYFGIKPRSNVGVASMPSRKWRLVVMLALVALSLALTGYAFYRSFRPKIVERVVEKPVEKIVEKPISQVFPQTATPPAAHKGKSTSKLPPPIINAPSCPNGICPTAPNFGTQTVFNETPVPHVAWGLDTGKTIRPTMVKNPTNAQWVKISVDKAFADPKFAVMCDRPCKGADYEFAGVGGYMHATWGKLAEYPNVAAFVIDGPNPFSSDATFFACIESEDDAPVKVLSVRVLTINKTTQP
jgi:hypothetical protein